MQDSLYRLRALELGHQLSGAHAQHARIAHLANTKPVLVEGEQLQIQSAVVRAMDVFQLNTCRLHAMEWELVQSAVPV